MSLISRYDPANCHEAGVDEAGRGCLAGDVYAAAVVFPSGYTNELINDSKKLTAARRAALAEVIRRDALAYAVGVATVAEIDRLNILNASMLAMQRALAEVHRAIGIDFILVDGNRFPGVDYARHRTVVHGDATYLAIAAASILAKTERDAAMLRLDADYPEYRWAVNKGYPTAAHRSAIAEFGATPWHRKTFKLLP